MSAAVEWAKFSLLPLDAVQTMVLNHVPSMAAFREAIQEGVGHGSEKELEAGQMPRADASSSSSPTPLQMAVFLRWDRSDVAHQLEVVNTLLQQNTKHICTVSHAAWYLLTRRWLEAFHL